MAAGLAGRQHAAPGVDRTTLLTDVVPAEAREIVIGNETQVVELRASTMLG